MRSTGFFRAGLRWLLVALVPAVLAAHDEILCGLDYGVLPPREVRVYLPPAGVTPATPVIVALDGQMMGAWQLEKTITALAAAGRVTPPLVVAIAAGDDRLGEYGLSGQPDFAGRGRRAAEFQRFVVDVVLPAVRARYAVSAVRAHTGVMGASLGGLAAFDLAWTHPGTFGFAGIFSGAFWWRGDNSSPAAQQASRLVHRRVRETPRPLAARIWFEAGTKDETGDRDGNGIIDAVQDTTDLIAELERAGLRNGVDVKYVEVAGGEHNEATWARVLPEFLDWVLPPARVLSPSATPPAG